MPRILEEIDSVPATEIARRLFRRQNTTLNLIDLLRDADGLVRWVRFGAEKPQPICVREGVFIDHVGAAMADAAACCNENSTLELWERCRAEEESRLQTARRAAAEMEVVPVPESQSVSDAHQSVRSARLPHLPGGLTD